MKVSKTISTVGVGAAIVVGSMLAVNAASAYSSDRQAEVVDRIATELNVDPADVQSIFDDMKAERQAEREERRAEYMAELVTQGVLTQEQADELAALHEEFKAEIMELKESGAEREEIKELREENRAALEEWAEAEGIDLDDIKPERGEGEGRKGDRGGFDDAEDDDEDAEEETDAETSAIEL